MPAKDKKNLAPEVRLQMAEASLRLVLEDPRATLVQIREASTRALEHITGETFVVPTPEGAEEDAKA